MKLAREYLALLREHSLRIVAMRHNGHIVTTVEHENGNTGIIVFPASVSDYRASQNLASEMRKIVRGQTPKRKEQQT